VGVPLGMVGDRCRIIRYKLVNRIKMDRQTRRKASDDILIQVMEYLKQANWTVDDYTLFHVDPITKSKYPTDTAFCIQLGRDMCR
jgi:hypothetical protein